MLISKYIKVEDIEGYIDSLTDPDVHFSEFDDRLVEVIRLVKAINYTDKSVEMLQNYVEDCMESEIGLNYTHFKDAENIYMNYKELRNDSEKELRDE